MKGRNIFESHGLAKFAFATAQPCVFISHCRIDKAKARAIARHIQDCGVDIYFDERDLALQRADESGNHQVVVRRIEQGLTQCSHLLGLITENTKESWWVPYEIGSATGHGRVCAHLIDGNVSGLPSYIQAATMLLDRKDIQKWLPRRSLTKIGSIAQELNILLEAANTPSWIPNQRSVEEIQFY